MGALSIGMYLALSVFKIQINDPIHVQNVPMFLKYDIVSQSRFIKGSK